MKVDHVVNRDTEISGNADSLDFSMDEGSMGLIMQGFSDSLYSDKIGSIVREITSNCFDSHIEAGVDTNVDIVISENMGTQQSTISFIDYGMGISPQRMKDIYSKYGASTKRDTNGQIGGWGFGAKVPFAYSHMFDVITRSEGTEYHYILHRGESVPKIELIDHNPTDKANGTEVRIPLKQESDADKFREAIRKQLPFFDNVNYHNCGVDNDYQIIRGKNFIYNESADHINDSGICLGKVYYPFPGSSSAYLGTSLTSGICLRFEVGDLSVTWSRESIENNDKNQEVIYNKFLAAKDELKEIQNRSKSKPITDIIEYVRQYKGEPQVPLGDEEVYAGGFVEGLKRDYYYLPKNSYYDNDPKHLFNDFGVWRVDYDGSSKRADRFRARNINWKSEEIYLLDIIDDPDWQILVAEEGTKIFKRTNVWIEEQKYPGKTLAIVKLAPNKSWTSYRGASGGDEQRQELKDAIHRYLFRKFPKYEDFKPSKDWIKEYNANNRAKKVLASEREKTQIHVAQITQHSAISENIYFDKIEEATKSGKIIVYGGIDATEMQQSLMGLLRKTRRFKMSEYNSNYLLSERVSFWRVNEDARKKLSYLDNTYTVDEFFIRFRNVMKFYYLNQKVLELQSKYYDMWNNFFCNFSLKYPIYAVLRTFMNITIYSIRSEHTKVYSKIVELFGEQFEKEEWVYKGVDLKSIDKKLNPILENIPFLSFLRVQNIYNEPETIAQVVQLMKQYYRTRLIHPIWEPKIEEKEETNEND